MKMDKPNYKTIEQIIEVMQMIEVGDDIVFDNMFGAFKITKLEKPSLKGL